MRRLSRYGWRAAEPARRPVLFVNPRSGGGRAAQAGLVERARERGINALVLGPHHDFAALVAEAVADGADALGVAGGDGSLGVAAAAARAHGLPFVCVPAGTRNHFALDAGVDRGDLVGSLDAFADGVERRIDVAEVNGRLFLNNVSLGIYGDAVRQPAYRDAKARTLAQTAAQVLGPSAPVAGLEVVDDRGRAHRDPAVVLVSNNPYSFEPPRAPGTRPRLDGGELGVVVLDRPRPREDPPARVWSATHLAVDAKAPVHAGVDGEAVELDAPLSFVIRAGALRVRISSRHPGVSPSGRLP
jgi:diacylglycerol kinase family enzyme